MSRPEPIGFVAATLHQDRLIGEIYMQAATDGLHRSGTRVAMIETGGDPGHAPARRVYQQAGYTALPVARFFKALPPNS